MALDKTKQPLYLPGLNGLRAIAALTVVTHHIFYQLKNFGLHIPVLLVDGQGNYMLEPRRVTIFFTLSGFLITWLFLKEKEKTGRIHIKDFYIRRILRIWPLYYLYLFACLAIIWVYQLNFIPLSAFFYVFLAANIPTTIGGVLPFLGHYWSLGVEEQFYLFFPQMAKLSAQKLLRMAILIILLFLLLKAVSLWVLQEKYHLRLPYQILKVNRFQTMLIGAAAAIFYRQNKQPFLRLATHKLTQIWAWSCLFLLAFNRLPVPSLIAEELLSLVTVCLMMGQITKRNHIFNLENRVCAFLGKISYGIYVIHPIVLFCLGKLLGTLPDKLYSYLLVYFSVTGTTILLAYLSYTLYEQRFLKLKKKFTGHSKQ
jgi:peptidoglycan/LPS O-acetylase OafA/YrhL